MKPIVAGQTNRGKSDAPAPSIDELIDAKVRAHVERILADRVRVERIRHRDVAGVRARTVLDWIHRGLLPAEHVGRDYLIRPEDLEAFFAAHRVGPRARPAKAAPPVPSSSDVEPADDDERLLLGPRRGRR